MRANALIASGISLLVASALVACGGDKGSAEHLSSTTIPQPTQAQLDASGLARFPFAPESKRIDLVAPSFSNPTEITNPLNPISEVTSAVVLGEVDGEALRIEITLLPETRIVEWNGQPVECVVSQFVGYLEGRMKEVALDLYAQGDDGDVWYFGEDVFNYGDDGHIADMEGAWLAGRDGPAGIITPDDPEVGDAYRSENIPGLVFEESTVKSIDVTVDGPRGRIDGAFEIDEHHQEGPEIKQWAPGYGEFYTRDGSDYELMALAVPLDALPGTPPAELTRISGGAAEIFGAGGVIDWTEASSAVEEMAADWASFQSGEVPDLLAGHMNDALDALERAVRVRKPVDSRLAATDVAVASLDFQLRHRPPAEIDLARLDLQAAMLGIDAAAEDLPAVRSDVANLDWIRDRIAHTLDDADRSRIDTEIVDAIGAAGDEDLAAVREIAAQMRGLLAGLTPAS
ncbi:MAG: hypothetical protein AABM42_03785 [Actinomycetota bacterium]